MKKMKRVLCALLATVILASLFVGCGKDEVPSDVSTITIWSANEHSRKFMEEEVKNFNETIGKEKGIIVEYTIMSDLSSQMDLALANGNAPDFITGILVGKQGEEGNIVSLDEIPGLEDLVEKYKDYRQYNGYNDKPYNLPAGVTTRALVYNKDMFKAAGIVDENGEATPPETFDELVEYAKKLTNAEKGEYGIALPGKWGTGWVQSDITQSMLSSVGDAGFDPITGTYDWTKLEPIVNAFMQIQKDGSNVPGFYTLDNDTARARFADGKIGMKYAHSFDVGVYNDQFPAKCDWGVAPLPVVDKDNKYMQQMEVGYGYSINARTYKEKGVEKIVEVFKWLMSDEMKAKECQGGYTIPVDAEIIDQCDFSNAKKGWKEFVEMVKISSPAPQPHGIEYNNNKEINAYILEDIWTGKVGVKEALANATKYYNEGIKLRQEARPDYDSSKFLKDSWNIER